VWAASLGTIVRYDGHGVETYRLPGIENTGLPVAKIAEVFVGPAQHVWAAGFDGRIFRFNFDLKQFEVAGAVNFPSTELQEAEFDGASGLWMGFSDGSCVTFDIEMQNIRQRCQGMKASVVDFFFGADSAFVLSEDGEILHFDYGAKLKRPVKRHDCASDNTKFTNLATLGNGSVLIGSRGKGLFTCSLQRHSAVSRIREPSTGELRKATIHEIVVDRASGSFIVATDSGLEVLKARSLAIEYSSRHAGDILATEFTALAIQDDQTIWASSFAGVYRLHASQAVVIKELPGTASPSIVGFSRLDEEIVIADYSGLFISKSEELSRGRSSSIDRLCDIPGGITAVANWRGGILYGLRSGGAFKITLNFGPTQCERSTVAHDIGPVSSIESEDDVVLIGTFGNGGFRFDPVNGLEKLVAIDGMSISQKRVLHIEPVKKAGYLLLTEGGIVAAPNQRTLPSPLHKIASLMKGKIPWAASTYGDYLWLATPTDGVYAISLEGFPANNPSVVSHHKLTGEVVQAVEALTEERAVVSTTTGLFTLFAGGGVERTLQSAGSDAVRFDFGASEKVRAGILFGGTGGFALVIPRKAENAVPSSLHRVTSYAVDQKEFQIYRPLTRSDKVVVGADDQRLTFKVGSLAPWSKRDVKLRYRLLGFDTDWSQGTSHNEISYTNLPSGVYEFQSQAKTPGDNWDSKVISFTVEVLPPWWRSNLAFLAYAITAVALFALIKHYYGTVILSRRATQLAREMSATADQAMEDMQEEVEMQARLLENVTSRNVATLSWIAELVDRQADTLPDALSSELAKVSLERIQAFVCLEHALQYRHDRVLADLRSFTDECSALLLSRRSGGNAVTLINEVTETLIDAEHAARLATVIYELLTNALNHAYADRQYGNFLRMALEISRTADAEVMNASITVEDNGVGLPEGIALEDYDTAGFSLVREVITYYSGKLERKTGSAGTSLRIELPLPADAVA
jgi:two-component sensor histidine kinase